MAKITSKTTKAELISLVSSLESQLQTVSSERNIALIVAGLAAILWLLF